MEETWNKPPPGRNCQPWSSLWSPSRYDHMDVGEALSNDTTNHRHHHDHLHDMTHRRIQGFVRGGKALLAPGGGARPSCPPWIRALLFGEQYFGGRGGGGQAPPPGSAHVTLDVAEALSNDTTNHRHHHDHHLDMTRCCWGIKQWHNQPSSSSWSPSRYDQMLVRR